MKVSPLEFRYGREEVKSIFSEESRLHYMLKVEGVIAEAEGKLGIIPAKAAANILAAVDSGKVDLQRVKELELKTRHDVMAIVNALTEKSGDSGAYVHYGATSQDINDTATAMQLRDFIRIMVGDITDLMEVLEKQVKKHRNTVMLGRTHGQHASPITFGLKMSVFLAETARHLERVMETSKRILVIKVMGPVGTGAFLGKDALKVQSLVADNLGLGFDEASTQVVIRDRYVEYLQVIANMAVSLEKFTTEIRNLQRPEIDEISEYFEETGQVGSSAMPSKVNPVDSENVSSLCRFIRALVTPEMESAVMWHERDLANSAVERFVMPYSSILIDYVLTKTAGIFASLKVNSEKMMKNLTGDDFSMSESIVLMLTSEGYPRQDAHEAVRKASIEARKLGKSLREYIHSSGQFSGISGEKIDNAFDPRKFLGVSGEICDNIMKQSAELRKKAEEWRKVRGKS